MATITVYTFEDAQGAEDSYTTQNPREAQERGRKYGLRVIANEYEFADSETAWDFRPGLECPECGGSSIAHTDDRPGYGFARCNDCGHEWKAGDQRRPPVCGACARIGTNDTRPMAHSPSCTSAEGR